MTITARPMVKSDARIRADIMSEIEWDPFIRDVPCKVTVENGAVTVTGQAPSLAARVSVIEAAHRVQGVLDVVDEMTVAPTPESPRSAFRTTFAFLARLGTVPEAVRSASSVTSSPGSPGVRMSRSATVTGASRAGFPTFLPLRSSQVSVTCIRSLLPA